MNEAGYIIALQQPDFSEVFISGVDIARDELGISHEKDDASIFETVQEATEFLDLIRPIIQAKKPTCKFFVDEL